MKKEEFSYCGLNCTTCKERFAVVKQKMLELDEAFEAVNIGEMARVIPFMNAKYRGYKKMAAFFKNECPGCRKKGGNPFCSIRRCAQKRGFFSCVECDTDMCKKFKPLLKVHHDNEIQNNREVIRKLG